MLFALLADWVYFVQLLALSVVRFLTIFVLLPVFGRETLPGMIRNAFAISLALIVVPVVAAQLPGERLPIYEFLLIVAKEALLGLMIGYSVAILFWAVGSIGALIDTQRGTAVAAVLNPQFGDQVTPVGNLLSQTVVTFFMVSGGFLVFLDGLYQSYQSWPVASFYPKLELAASRFFLEQLDLLLYLTVFLAGPVILAMFIAEFGLGLISRFVPQLNVFVLAMPVKSGVGLFLLILYLGALMVFLDSRLRELATTFDVLDVLLR